MKLFVRGLVLCIGVAIVGSFALYEGTELVQSSSDSGPQSATPQSASPQPTGSAPQTPTNAGGLQTRVELTAHNLAFDKRSITVPVGQQITIVFHNQDLGVLHNFSLYTNRTASEKLFVGELTTGPDTRDYVFAAPARLGNYYFRCDVHPETMNGTFVVK